MKIVYYIARLFRLDWDIGFEVWFWLDYLVLRNMSICYDFEKSMTKYLK